MDVEREIDRLDERVRSLEGLAIAHQFREIRSDLEELKRMFEDRRREREGERREALKEKKSDRRWQFGASLTAASLVVGAAALLLQAFGGSP